MRLSIVIIFGLMCVIAWDMRIHDSMKRQIVSLQLDRDEIRVHTDLLAQIVKTQDYQIGVLTEMVSK